MVRQPFVVFFLVAVASTTSAQELGSAQNLTVESSEIAANHDLQFRLEPVELQITEELLAAKDQYERGEWNLVIDQMTKFVTEYPADDRFVDALFLRAESLVQLKRYAEARRDFTQLLTINPNTTQKSHAQFRIAEATMLLEERSEAQQLLEQFGKDYPNHELNAYVLPYLAETVARAGNTAWASSLYVESLQQFPNGPLTKESRLRLALLKYQEDDFQSAYDKLFQVVETSDRTSTEFWTASYWLAMAEFRTNRFKSAADRILSFTEAQPNHEFNESATYHAAEAYRRLNENQKALNLFQQLHNNWPDSKYATQSTLAEMQLAGQLGESDRAFELYASLSGTEAKIQYDATRLVAKMLIKDKRFDEASDLIKPLASQRRSLITSKARDDHHTNLYLYGLARRGMGKFNQAGQLLGRIRLDLVNSDLAQQVLLARAETFNLAKEFNAAVEEGFDYERRFPTGQLLAPIRTEMVLGMIGANRRNEAKIKFRQLLRQDESDPRQLARAARQLGEASYEAGDFLNSKEVFEVLETVHENDEDLAQALSALAWIELKKGNREEAAKRFEEFIARFPGHPSTPEVRLAHAQNLAASGQSSSAIEALEFFKDLNPSDPTRARALYQLAELMHRDPNKMRPAGDLLDQLLLEHKTFQQRDAALYLLGIIRLRLKGDTADEAFLELVENHRTSKFWSDALYRLAESAEARKSKSEAKKHLTKLISAERDRQVLPHALYMMGRIESDEKNWKEARDTLRNLLRRFPRSPLVPVARYGVAESFYQEKQYDRALQLFEILNQNNNFDQDDAWGAMIQLRRAQVLVEKQDLVTAIGVAEKIEKTFPDFSLQHEADYLMARALASRGDFTRARQSYAKVIKSDHNRSQEVTAMAQWMIGETYLHQKKYILAIKAYEALVSDTNYPKWQAASYLQIGKCYESLDNPDQARKAYTRIVDRFGGTDSAVEAKHRVQVLDQA